MIPVLLFFALIPFAYSSRVVIEGTVLCDGKPYAGALVKLYDKGKKIKVYGSDLTFFMTERHI